VEGVVRCADHIATPNPQWDGAKPDPGTSMAPYRLYNIGNNNPVQLMNFIAALEKALGKKAQMNFLPMQLGDVPETYADIDDLAEDIGYRPKTRIAEGIAKFIDWYRGYYGE